MVGRSVRILSLGLNVYKKYFSLILFFVCCPGCASPPPPARSPAVCVPTFPPVGSARGRVHRVYCDTADSRPRPPVATHPAQGQWRGACVAAARRLAPDWPPAATPLPPIGCVLPAASRPEFCFCVCLRSRRVKLVGGAETQRARNPPTATWSPGTPGPPGPPEPRSTDPAG